MATVVGPYTHLLVQLLGILLGGAALAMLVGWRPPLSAVPMAVSVLLAILALPALWGASGAMDGVRASLTTAPGIRDQESCILEGGHGATGIEFVRWLEQRMPSSARFAYAAGRYDTPCVQYALLPRRIVARSDSPQFMVYVAPREEADKARLREQRRLPAKQRSLEFFAKDIALEKLR